MSGANMSGIDEKFSKKNFLLVFNGEAGHACHKKQSIIKYLSRNNCQYKFVTTNELANEKNLNSYDAVVAVGGDGTVLKVIPHLVNTDIRLGIIPCGTANLFAASLCIPKNVYKAVNILINGSVAKTDIGKAGNEYFALRVGVGYDAEVVNNAGRFWKKKLGYLAYLIQGIISCFHLTTKAYKITIDDKTLEVNANSIIIANAGNMFKNLFTIAPSGAVDDGKLDVFILVAGNIREFLMALAEILFGRHFISHNIIYGQARNIRIESNYKNVHIDGEARYDSNLDISVIPKALAVVVP